MARVVISSVSQFLGLVEQNPALMSVPSLNVIRAALSTQHTKSCNCVNKQAEEASKKRELLQSALSVLSPKEQSDIKRILNHDRFCYNKKSPNGQINLICF